MECESLCIRNLFYKGRLHALALRPEVDKRVTTSEEVVIDFTEAAGTGSVQIAL